MKKKNLYYIERIQKEIKYKLSIILKRDINDKRINNISIIDVKLHKDLSLLKVFIFSLNNILLNKNMKILNNASNFIKKILFKFINIKFYPKLIFLYDDSVEKSFKISELIKKVNN